jgi:hypothetical protein
MMNPRIPPATDIANAIAVLSVVSDKKAAQEVLLKMQALAAQGTEAQHRLALADKREAELLSAQQALDLARAAVDAERDELAKLQEAFRSNKQALALQDRELSRRENDLKAAEKQMLSEQEQAQQTVAERMAAADKAMAEALALRKAVEDKAAKLRAAAEG